ncbi:cytochrome b [Aquabacterium sp.]|uniref:cytochrome b n=1 Tax=Aquabacterium sp. TaxID=1872578 RepID=UPI0035AEA85E
MKSNAYGAVAPTAWPKTVRALHWLTVMVILATFALILGREFLDDDDLQAPLLQWHRYAGMAAWLITLARIPLRSMADAPDHELGAMARKVSSAVHGLLYLMLLAMPVIGYLLVCARTGKVDFLGMPLPVLIARNRDLAETIETIHGVIGWTMLGLIGAHAAAALWHHFFVKDNVLKSMLGSRPRLN